MLSRLPRPRVVNRKGEYQLGETHSDDGGRTKSPAGSPIFVLAVAFLVLAAGVVWTLCQVLRATDTRSTIHEPRTALRPRTPWKNVQPHVQYVGDAVCARCHAEIADTFRRHPMGRSLGSVSAGAKESDGTITFEASNSRYSVESREGHVVHRETRMDERGRMLAQVEGEVKFALGSGSRGISYLIEHDGRLFQSPITWYSQKNQWDLSPGYEASNLHFDRAIEPGCLFCHANRFELIAHTLNRYEQPIFRGEAIGCERCHGPGELHAQHPEMVDGRDYSIVNPRHLEPALRDAVCEQCHLQGDHRIDRLGRDMFDYRPGLPLIEFFAIYGKTEQQETKFVGQVEQMKRSRCFRESQGRLGCASCHDPHQVPAPNERVAYFRQQCLACHERKGCNLPDTVRLAESSEDSCIQCHMQPSKKTDIIHAATTDHQVLRTPQADQTDQAPVALGLPLVLLNGDNLAPNELKSLERELAIALATEGPRMRDSPQVRETGALVLGLLNKAVERRPDDLPAMRMKAQALALSGRQSDALRVIRSALTLAPTDEKALDQYLSYAVDAKDIVAAVEIARRAVAANPWSSVFHERLAHFSLERADYAESLRASQEALRLNPFLRFARMFMIQSLLKQHETSRADAEFDILVKIHASQRTSLETWYAERRRN
jgi:Cytochrome c554 and c-prime